jgi:hypothetical protein
MLTCNHPYQSEKCSVCILSGSQLSVLIPFPPSPGFLPVLYAALHSKRTHPVQLPLETPDDEVVPVSKLNKLHGWGYLLFWAPAICDLTGTTVYATTKPNILFY